jgi:hypothetical protein
MKMRSMFRKSKLVVNLAWGKMAGFLVCEKCGVGETKAVVNQYGQVVDSTGGATLVKGANGKYRCKEHITGVLKPRRERRGNTKQDKKARYMTSQVVSGY